VLSRLDDNTVMMNELTAQMTHAQPGDALELRALDGSSQWFTVGRILPHSQIGGSELLMTPGAADRLGVVGDTEMIVWDIRSRSAFDTAVQNLGLMSRPNTKVNRSWDPLDPDDALSTARLKSMVGEPWYQVVSGDTIERLRAAFVAVADERSLEGARATLVLERFVVPDPAVYEATKQRAHAVEAGAPDWP